jgi:hypothetical protein
MNQYQCEKTGRVCYSYDQWLRTELIKLPECSGCRSNREKPEVENQPRTENENEWVLNIDQDPKRSAD